MTLYPYVGARNATAFAAWLEGFDPERRIDAALWRHVDPDGRTLLDIGAGNGWLACRFARRCARVHALEPDPNMLQQLHAALAAPGAPAHVSVLPDGADAIPLPDASVDIVHARFAYFFGNDACLPGLAEARRVLAPGGHLFVIDSSTHGQFGEIYVECFADHFADQSPTLAWWAAQGFDHEHIETVWRPRDRDAMALGLGLEHPRERVEALMARFSGDRLTTGVHLFHWRKPDAC